MRLRRTSVPLLLVFAALALLATGCGGGEQAGTYYCPMHPTYVSDRPGTCPICNMDLVERVAAPVAAAATPGADRHDAPDPSGALHACPMHPEVVSDRRGICAKCGMDLTPAGPGAELPTVIWTCPMHPEVASDVAGRCPKCRMDLEPRVPSAAAGAPASGERRILFYRNPMDPTVTSPVPAKDPMGMEYLPVWSDEVGGATDTGVPGHAAVETSAEGLRLAGVRTEEVREERLGRTIRTVGTVVVDERRLHRAQVKVSGWVEKLHVSFTGQEVRRGQPMLSIYSPELLATQEEYLLAKRHAERFLGSSVPEVRRGGEELVEAARRRLELFDVPARFLDELERTGRVRRTVDLPAPASGHVVSLEVVAGAQVQPGMELFTVADLSRVWVEADFYESEARFVAPGRRARLALPYDPEAALEGTVSYVYPEVNAETRTLRARFDLANPGLVLKPGMFVDVELDVDLGEGIVVADSAVLDSGLRQIVFVETGPGRFEPRVVQVLWRGDGKARLAPGVVVAGERVAVRANFLLDSESRLRAALEAVGGTAAAAAADPHAGHGGQP